MKTDSLSYYEICKRLTINPDDEFILKNFDILWSPKKPCTEKHISLSDGSFNFISMNNNIIKPESVEYDMSIIIESPIQSNEAIYDKIEIGSQVVVCTKTYVNNVVFHYDGESHKTLKFILEYKQKIGNISQKNEYSDDITILYDEYSLELINAIIRDAYSSVDTLLAPDIIKLNYDYYIFKNS